MINKLARRLIIWAFKNKVKVHFNQRYMSHEELSILPQDAVTAHIRSSMLYELFNQLLDDGIIEFTEEDHKRIAGKMFKVRIITIK